MPRKNPVAEFVEAEGKTADDRKQRERDQLARWRQTQDPAHLEPILKAYEPVIARKMSQWKAPDVHPAAFKAELQKHLIRAAETYDPSRNVAFNTHVENLMRKALRFNNNNANLARIPEGQAALIGKIRDARTALREEFGQDPTHDQLGDYLGMSPKRVAKIETAQRRDIPASMLETDPQEVRVAREREVLGLLHKELNPDELSVFNHIYGRDGARKLEKTEDIARALGVSSSRVSRLRTSIGEKFKKFY